MATAHKHAPRSRGRVVRPRRSARSRIAVGVAILLTVALVVALVMQGQSAQKVAPVTVSSHPVPPGSEPNGRAWGPADAPIKIEEFVDYQCPSCQEYAAKFEAGVVTAFASSGKVRYEIHNFQFKGEDSANAAEGGYCAAEQNSFWPFHSSLFASLPEVHRVGVFSDARLGELATRLGLDRDRFDECLSSERYAAQVQADYQEAVRRGINSTPTFVINGQPYTGVHDAAELRSIIDQIAPGVLP